MKFLETPLESPVNLLDTYRLTANAWERPIFVSTYGDPNGSKWRVHKANSEALTNITGKKFSRDGYRICLHKFESDNLKTMIRFLENVDIYLNRGTNSTEKLEGVRMSRFLAHLRTSLDTRLHTLDHYISIVYSEDSKFVGFSMHTKLSDGEAKFFPRVLEKKYVHPLDVEGWIVA